MLILYDRIRTPILGNKICGDERASRSQHRGWLAGGSLRFPQEQTVTSNSWFSLSPLSLPAQRHVLLEQKVNEMQCFRRGTAQPEKTQAKGREAVQHIRSPLTYLLFTYGLFTDC